MPLLSILITLHVLSAVIWVGGMFFAYMAMRPAVVKSVDPALRPALWAETLERFLRWVWLAVALLVVTGYAMLFGWFGGMAMAPVYIHIMQGLGIVMVLLFMHVWFAPFRRLKTAVEIHDLGGGAQAISQIRRFVGINLILGLTVVAVASGGRYLVAG